MGTPGAAAARGFESVTAYLERDHDRLDSALSSLSEAVEMRQFNDAARLYEEFERGLLRHVRIEEELVFPVFEARSGMAHGPTVVLRDEHRQVRRALAFMRRGIEDGDAGEYAEGRRFFEAVRPDHVRKEEHILYPILDILLRPGERIALIERLQREALV